MKIELKPFQRKYLQGLAHGIDPVVMVGNNGLTEAVVREIAISLDAHELIKVRVLGDDRDARIAMFEQICDDWAAPLCSTSASFWCCGAPATRRASRCRRTSRR